MVIIFNSDILIGTGIKNSIPDDLIQLLSTCKDKGIRIVLPETSLLEFNRKQKEFSKQTKKRITDAYRTLDRFGIFHGTPDLEIIVKTPDLVAILKEIDFEIEIEKPTKEDYDQAHVKACDHSLQPPDTTSDEMRDLIIWEISKRLSTQNSKALLISADGIHNSEMGDEEANMVGLTRVDSIEKALEFLGMETPAGKYVKRILQFVWNQMKNEGVPILDEISNFKIDNESFAQKDNLIVEAKFSLEIESADKKILKANFDMHTPENKLPVIHIENIIIEGKLWKEHIKISSDTELNLSTIENK